MNNKKPTEEKMRRTLAALEAFTLAARGAPRVAAATFTALGALTLGAGRAQPNPPDVLRISDEELDHWGDFYVLNRLDRTGVRFENFLLDPHALAPQLLARARMPRVRAITVPAAARDAAEDLIFLRKQAD